MADFTFSLAVTYVAPGTGTTFSKAADTPDDVIDGTGVTLQGADNDDDFELNEEVAANLSIFGLQ